MTSEIRANTLKNRVGLGTVSFTNTGPVVSGIVTANTLRLPDSTSGSLGRLQLGNNNDLQLFHDASDSYIQNQTGVFFIQNTGDLRIRVDNTDAAIHCVRNGTVELYHNNVKRLETSSVGVSIPQDLDVDGHTNLDNVSIAGVTTGTTINATTFVGALTGTASGNPTLTSGANDRIITATGANTIQGESTLTYGTSGQLKITRAAQSNVGLYVFHSDGNEVGHFGNIGSGNEGILALKDGGTDTVILNGETGGNSYINSGNVGIGTQIADYKTTIAADGINASLNLKRLSTSVNGQAFGNIFYTTETGQNVVSVRGVRESSNADGAFTISTKPTSGTLDERLRINSGGNLQLGVSVNAGNALRYLDIGNYNTGGSAGSILRLLTVKSDGSSSTSADIVKYKAGGLVINNNEAIGTSGYISFGTATGGGSVTERMRIQSTGIVKVETNDSSSFNAHLLVNNSESNSGISLIGSGSSFSAGGWAAVTDAGIIRSSANSSNGLVLQAASGNLRFYAGGNPPAERFRIASDGTPAFYSPAVAWHEGPAVLEASNGFAEIFFRSTGSTHGTSVTGSWSIGKLSGSNGFGILKNGMTGSGAVRADAALSISDAGDITIGKKMLLPNTVAFSARGGPSDLTNAVIVFGTQVFQRGGTNYSTSTGIFTAPVDGIYHFMCNPYRYSTSDDSYLTLQKSTNSGASWNSEIEIRIMTTGAVGWASLGLSQIIDLNANDQVRMYATNRVHCNGVFSRFSGFLVA